MANMGKRKSRLNTKVARRLKNIFTGYSMINMSQMSGLSDAKVKRILNNQVDIKLADIELLAKIGGFVPGDVLDNID